ncbi:MAG: hypothetical protein U0359_19120 [Byssovorax sp.]
MAANRGKQKAQQKQKKKREIARKKAVHAPRGLGALSPSAILKMAAELPFGPCFVSGDWDEQAEVPNLVTVVATRRAPQGMLIPAIALVDRTCLGIKNGFVAQPIPEAEIDPWLEPMAQTHGEMREVEPLVVQSVVFHAIDYARSLGFSPHRDFPAPIFGPRPETLLDTPLARPARPIYINGPDDHIAGIVAQLDRAVGPGNYQVVMVQHADEDDFDDEDEDDAAG